MLIMTSRRFLNLREAQGLAHEAVILSRQAKNLNRAS